MRELELYIHIPFCVKKCGYCDFLSAPATEQVRQAYLRQLEKEIAAQAYFYKDCVVTSVFVGGGTPSLLAPGQIERLFARLFACFSITSDAEVSIECNPGTLDGEKLAAYKNAGMNRLSIGLQSADDTELKLLGRIHTSRQFFENFALARDRGFENINIDLMSALPGQTAASYERTLLRVTALMPEHISAYSLIIEEGTPFFERFREAELLRERDMPQSLLPSEDEERLMYAHTRSILAAAGYERYEISNYARRGYECRHNLGYWSGKNYLGLGLGAASLVDHIRFSNTSDLQTYLSTDFMQVIETNAQNPAKSAEDTCGTIQPGHLPVSEKTVGYLAVQKPQQPSATSLPWQENREALAVPRQMEEFMFLGLRKTRGIASQDFLQQFHVTIESVYGDVLKHLQAEHLLEKTPSGFRLTDYGIDVSNYALAQFLMD